MDVVKFLEFCEHIGSLKHLKRTGWVRCGINEPETVASHMYRMGILAMCVRETSLDGHQLHIDKCIRMALVHDMGEAIVGDITPHCGVGDKDKYELESKAFDTLKSLLPAEIGDQLRSLWDEYEANKTIESKFVHDLDKFDMLVQAFEYEKRENEPRKLEQFFKNTRHVFQTSLVKGWMVELEKQRDACEN